MLEALLTPTSIAVIGASRKPGKVGHEIVANLVDAGFKGEIVPVNPACKEILGLTCYQDLGEHGGKIDLAVIAIPTKAVRGAVERSIRAGAQAVVIITAGFKEVGEEGALLERELADLCTSRGVRLLGPNCLGLINTHHRMNASFANRMPEVGNISIISQSGALCTAILDWAAARHLGLAKLISIGNKADLDETDFLTAFARDDESKVIVGYLESIVSGDAFVRAAEAAASVKPVVVMKAGTTESGGKAASSHTGSHIAYGAAFKRSGIIRAETFEALFDYATALAMQPVPKGDRVAIITNAGGPGIMAADAVENAGLHVATLGDGTATALRAKLPAAASVGNPIDVLGDADPERYATAVKAAQEDEAVDAIIVILAPQALTSPAETALAVAERVRIAGSDLSSSPKPVLAAFMGGEDVMPGRYELVASGLPDYPAPERAVAALKAMLEYANWCRRPPRAVTRFPVNRRRVERIIARHLRIGRLQVSEAKAKEILRAYDFAVPEGRLCSSVEEAMEVAKRVGYPVVMKISSPDVIHKSDIGGVRLGISNAEEVRDAFDLMVLRVNRKIPEARIEGVYVEKMCPSGREVIIGMKRDQQFGPMLMFGLGGIFVEVMKDVTFHLAPITADEAMQMLMGTRSYALLKGTRGHAGVDLKAVAGTLQRVSQLATDFPQIAELDINPLIVGEMGTEPAVADARITLAESRTRK